MCYLFSPNFGYFRGQNLSLILNCCLGLAHLELGVLFLTLLMNFLKEVLNGISDYLQLCQRGLFIGIFTKVISESAKRNKCWLIHDFIGYRFMPLYNCILPDGVLKHALDVATRKVFLSKIKDCVYIEFSLSLCTL